MTGGSETSNWCRFLERKENASETLPKGRVFVALREKGKKRNIPCDIRFLIWFDD